MPKWIAVFALLSTTAHADVRITRDPGGNLNRYAQWVNWLRYTRERVIVDGPCNSACTLVLTLPRSQLCATRRASFTFHTPVDSRLGLPVASATDWLWSAYPDDIKVWIGQNGGLTFIPITLRGTALARMVPHCG